MGPAIKTTPLKNGLAGLILDKNLFWVDLTKNGPARLILGTKCGLTWLKMVRVQKLNKDASTIFNVAFQLTCALNLALIAM